MYRNARGFLAKQPFPFDLEFCTAALELSKYSQRPRARGASPPDIKALCLIRPIKRIGPETNSAHWRINIRFRRFSHPLDQAAGERVLAVSGEILFVSTVDLNRCGVRKARRNLPHSPIHPFLLYTRCVRLVVTLEVNFKIMFAREVLLFLLFLPPTLFFTSLAFLLVPCRTRLSSRAAEVSGQSRQRRDVYPGRTSKRRVHVCEARDEPAPSG
ncbi:hypothetical protein RRG08_011423 [Elysia crispata]|uniref:Uncharacterized protein n=1 Tax=Elysia crispata TaxID=231223 RepID=A0AAE1AGE6_9GAST|nr:hypothetical protein RRG08_011423 [Elysia crispata]